ncbi:gluconolactonase [Caballeronia glebae]|uniref:Gluconolactonase n=1 Tax=Caballeronia glebae TaxID=1777143 RepID=A0A158AZM8_9BURK|nr:SMP-30/gluconolactonase/LRE family protein [Caballeronia glebae]SAK63183.1 gluconolactonase [Caballeronia glebae]
MKARLRIAALLGLLITIAAPAQETVVASNVLGPEGPLVVDGKLYFVGWESNQLVRMDDGKQTVINSDSKCSQNGLALTKRKTFLLACDAEPGAIIETDLNGKELRRWETVAEGQPMAGGVNDIVVTSNDGAYATLTGPGGDQPPVVGKVLYLRPGAKQWQVVADHLNHANGIAVSPDQKTLYVAETFGNTIKMFKINSDGSLHDRANFAFLNLLVDDPVKSMALGPDSMKVDHAGNLYVAQWKGGKVLKISPKGQLLHVFKIAEGDGTTNVAFDEGEKNLYVTVVKDTTDKKYAGSVVRLPNE